ncbi:MAG: hypothetical protein AAGJ70_11460, partial [Pseudomonadota bacterium]
LKTADALERVACFDTAGSLGVGLHIVRLLFGGGIPRTVQFGKPEIDRYNFIERIICSSFPENPGR